MSSLKRKLKDSQKAFIELLQSKYGPVVTRKQILAEASTPETKKVGDFLIRLKNFRVKWGNYNLASILDAHNVLVNPPADLPVPSAEDASVSV